MTRPRSELIALEDTPYYHCVSRCVRRAFLCGDDHYTGQNFDHRKQWIVDRLKLLGEVFTIDIAAYAIMSNHYHVVLHVDKDRCDKLSKDQIIERWQRIYKGDVLIQRYQKQWQLTDAEQLKVDETVEKWRSRLCSISWFMACFKEYIARKANEEDGCKGHFWESRFKSQALLDEAALLSCMAYVDLNPVRAGITDTLEASDFTSIQDRIKEIQQLKQSNVTPPKQDKPKLMPFIESEHHDKTFTALPFNLKDYLELIDWTGRCIRDDKRGYIPQSSPNLLATLDLSAEQWLALTLDIQKRSISFLNGLDQLGKQASLSDTA